MQETKETRVRSLGQDDPLEGDMVTPSSLLAWRIPWTGSLAGYSPWGCRESYKTEATYHLSSLHILLGSNIIQKYNNGRGGGISHKVL